MLDLLTRLQLLADPFKDQNIGIHTHAQGQNQRRHTWQRQGGTQTR